MALHRKQFTTEVAGTPLILELSDLAGQADAAVFGRYGDTAVLATVVMGKEESSSDYFPLTVDYEERFYAAGKILGSRFVRREGRPSEEAVLSGRIIDRTIRPLFDHRIRRNAQVVITILEIDDENDPDFIALLAASTALGLSPIPWGGPVAGMRVFFDGEKLTLNPTNSEVRVSWPREAAFHGFIAGTAERINMIECEGIDAKDDAFVAAAAEAHKEIKRLIEWQKKIVSEEGAQKAALPLREPDAALKEAVSVFLADTLEHAVYAKDKTVYEENVRSLKHKLAEHLKEKGFDEAALRAMNHLWDEEVDALIHRKILKDGVRPDGRAPEDLRPLHAEVGFLKRTHGSALFMRGNTQALAITTLGPPGAEQLIETMEFSGKRRFMLHYNFPPYSVGETGRIGGPGRREIGHGALAEKAVRNLIPPQEEFPYTIRVVSEIISSNGSSSMATVCGASLSLMDAGVPIKKSVAGIAMGLIASQSPIANRTSPDYKILTDLQGPEDHYGDMDFKVAGTRDGIRAIQLDVKIEGLTEEMIAATLAQAAKARGEILSVMEKAISAPRKELSPYAPSILKIRIDPARIGELIGPGGKIINAIIGRTGATINVEQDGNVYVAGSPREKAEAALKEIEGIFHEYKIGEIVEGPVVKILEFGAIVEFGSGKDGMIHVSELKEGFVKRVEDVVKVGDRVRAKIIRADPDGRIGLSLKALGR